MAIDEITGAKSVVPTVTQSRASTTVPRSSTPSDTVTNPLPASVAEAQDLTPAQNAALLINETLQNLNVSPSASDDARLLNGTNPELTLFIENQTLSPIQQAALAVNETLQTLNFETPTSTDGLLLDEINPELTLFVENQTLTPVQQAAVALNETMQTLATPPAEQPQSTISTAAAADVAQNLNSGQANTLQGTLSAAITGTTGIVAQETTPSTSTVSTPLISAIAIERTVTSETLAPSAPTFLPITDRNPIAVPVYEIRDPKPAPAEPKTRKKVVFPSVPVGRVRPVDPLVLRQEWEQRKKSQQREEISPRPPLEERAIREMISRTNEDLAANGLPLRLVLAKNSEGAYNLDVYDCSADALCQLSNEIPINLNNLLTILDNIEHESGIIINIMT